MSGITDSTPQTNPVAPAPNHDAPQPIIERSDNEDIQQTSDVTSAPEDSERLESQTPPPAEDDSATNSDDAAQSSELSSSSNYSDAYDSEHESAAPNSDRTEESSPEHDLFVYNRRTQFEYEPQTSVFSNPAPVNEGSHLGFKTDWYPNVNQRQFNTSGRIPAIQFLPFMSYDQKSIEELFFPDLSRILYQQFAMEPRYESIYDTISHIFRAKSFNVRSRMFAGNHLQNLKLLKFPKFRPTVPPVAASHTNTRSVRTILPPKLFPCGYPRCSHDAVVRHLNLISKILKTVNEYAILCKQLISTAMPPSDYINQTSYMRNRPASLSRPNLLAYTNTGASDVVNLLRSGTRRVLRTQTQQIIDPYELRDFVNLHLVSVIKMMMYAAMEYTVFMNDELLISTFYNPHGPDTILNAEMITLTTHDGTDIVAEFIEELNVAKSRIKRNYGEPPNDEYLLEIYTEHY